MRIYPLTDIKDLVEILVITKGDQGSLIYSKGKEYEIPVVPPDKIVDPTGVGDAFRGGFLTGMGYDLDLELCGKIGSLAAAYCLETDGPQSHSYTAEGVCPAFQAAF